MLCVLKCGGHLLNLVNIWMEPEEPEGAGGLASLVALSLQSSKYGALPLVFSTMMRTKLILPIAAQALNSTP